MPTVLTRVEFWAVALALAIFAVGVYVAPGSAADRLELATAYSAVLIVLLFGVLVLVAIATGKLDLAMLLTESQGGASMSRFQLLVFTIVIAMCFMLVAVAKKGAFPSIPKEVLELLGVSASTYAVSKGIQASGLPSKTASPQSPQSAESKKDSGGG